MAITPLLEYIRDKFDMEFLFEQLVSAPVGSTEDYAGLEEQYQAMLIDVWIFKEFS